MARSLAQGQAAGAGSVGKERSFLHSRRGGGIQTRRAGRGNSLCRHGAFCLGRTSRPDRRPYRPLPVSTYPLRHIDNPFRRVTTRWTIRIVWRCPEALEWVVVQNSDAYEVEFTALWDGLRGALWSICRMPRYTALQRAISPWRTRRS